MIAGLRVYGRNRALIALGRRRGKGIAGIVVLNELSDFFFKRHLAKQAIHSGLEDWIGELSVGWMRGFPRIVRWSRFGGLCRCIRFASGHYQQDDCTEKKAAEAEIL
jgi:hypothetical protein